MTGQDQPQFHEGDRLRWPPQNPIGTVEVCFILSDMFQRHLCYALMRYVELDTEHQGETPEPILVPFTRS